MSVHLLRSTFFSFFFFLFRATPVAYGSSKAGVDLELQLPAYTTATATRDQSCIYNLHHSSWQPTPDPSPSERGRGSNPHPHGC